MTSECPPNSRILQEMSQLAEFLETGCLFPHWKKGKCEMAKEEERNSWKKEKLRRLKRMGKGDVGRKRS